MEISEISLPDPPDEISITRAIKRGIFSICHVSSGSTELVSIVMPAHFSFMSNLCSWYINNTGVLQVVEMPLSAELLFSCTTEFFSSVLYSQCVRSTSSGTPWCTVRVCAIGQSVYVAQARGRRGGLCVFVQSVKHKLGDGVVNCACLCNGSKCVRSTSSGTAWCTVRVCAIGQSVYVAQARGRRGALCVFVQSHKLGDGVVDCACLCNRSKCVRSTSSGTAWCTVRVCAIGKSVYVAQARGRRGGLCVFFAIGQSVYVAQARGRRGGLCVFVQSVKCVRSTSSGTAWCTVRVCAIGQSVYVAQARGRRGALCVFFAIGQSVYVAQARGRRGGLCVFVQSHKLGDGVVHCACLCNRSKSVRSTSSGTAWWTVRVCAIGQSVYVAQARGRRGALCVGQSVYVAQARGRRGGLCVFVQSHKLGDGVVNCACLCNRSKCVRSTSSGTAWCTVRVCAIGQSVYVAQARGRRGALCVFVQSVKCVRSTSSGTAWWTVRVCAIGQSVYVAQARGRHGALCVFVQSHKLGDGVVHCACLCNRSKCVRSTSSGTAWCTVRVCAIGQSVYVAQARGRRGALCVFFAIGQSVYVAQARGRRGGLCVFVQSHKLGDGVVHCACLCIRSKSVRSTSSGTAWWTVRVCAIGQSVYVAQARGWRGALCVGQSVYVAQARGRRGGLCVFVQSVKVCT
ncbi:hypothetical protein RRG08_041435 [Elysia crispata]|uniref:Uncharacterized protein n=1 Tax=Elysia crispata TaxID=231223 RepID=A0AAE1CJ38_9GAST|nr:hypothetical protein RRG08_041435 [Elysia crispata]